MFTISISEGSEHGWMLRSDEILPYWIHATSVSATPNLPNRSARRRRSRASNLPGGASPSSSTPQTALSEFIGRGATLLGDKSKLYHDGKDVNKHNIEYPLHPAWVAPVLYMYVNKHFKLSLIILL